MSNLNNYINKYKIKIKCIKSGTHKNNSLVYLRNNGIYKKKLKGGV